MRKSIADRQFIKDYYGNDDTFCIAVHDDFCKTQLNWSFFIDGLCKNGEITQHQYETWAFPGNRYKRRGTSHNDT